MLPIRFLFKLFVLFTNKENKFSLSVNMYILLSHANQQYESYSNISYKKSIEYTVIFLTENFNYERIYRTCHNRYHHICRLTDHISSYFQFKIPAN